MTAWRGSSSCAASRGWCSRSHAIAFVVAVVAPADAAPRRRRCRWNARPRRAGSSTPSSPGRTGGWSNASALGRRAAREPVRVVRPCVRIDGALDPPPRGADVVVVVAFEPEPVLEQAGAAGSVDQPARARCVRGHPARTRRDARHLRRLVAARAPWRRATSTPSSRARSARKFSKRPRSSCHDGVGSSSLTPSSVQRAGSPLPSEKKKRKPNLRTCSRSRWSQAEGFGEVVRADFHRRFADLERALRRIAGAAFEHRDRERRIALFQLDREAQPGEAAAEDGDIAAFDIRVDGVHASRGAMPAGIRRQGRRSPAGSRARCGAPRGFRRGAGTASRCGW